MMKFKLAALLAACTMVASPAFAVKTFHIQYVALSGNPANADFVISASDTLNAVGGYDILSVSGNVDGDLITGLELNLNQPNESNSIDHQWFFNNVLYMANPFLNTDGFVFHTLSGKSGNLWGNSPDNYTLGTWTPVAGFAISTGNASIAAVPEPASWALMLGGFGLIGSAMRRRSTSVSFA